MRRVVITGIGTVSPLGLTTGEFWSNLIAGKAGVRRIERFDPAGFASQIGGEVPAYKIIDHVPKNYRKATKVMARDIELAVIAAKDAFESSGLASKANSPTDEPDFNPRRFGCNIGAGLISAELDELTYAMNQARTAPGSSQIDWQKWGREGMGQLTPLWLLKYLPNMLACHVTIIHGLTGPSNNITCAEASGHLSIGESVRAIRRGKCDFAIAGGAESRINPMGMMRHQLLGRLNATSNDDPAAAVRPFDKAAAGTAVSEGGALLILEEFEHAKARGATIYAEIAGFGSSQDTFDPSLPDPKGKAYAAACRTALGEAKADAADVDLIVPHGLGIPHHDHSELAGLRRVFGDNLSKPAFCPIKAQIGMAAAGSCIDLAAATLAVHHGIVPPAINTTSPIDSSLNVSREARETKPTLALSPIFGLGGQNAAIALRRI